IVEATGFYFQAEDGIRDDLVTGVQTCALPIYFFESGITGVRDVGSQGDVTFRLKEWVREDRLASSGRWKLERTTVEHLMPRTDETIQFMAKKGVARHDADSV